MKNEIPDGVTFETPFGEAQAANIAEVTKDPRLEEYEDMSEKVCAIILTEFLFAELILAQFKPLELKITMPDTELELSCRL